MANINNNEKITWVSRKLFSCSGMFNPINFNLNFESGISESEDGKWSTYIETRIAFVLRDKRYDKDSKVQYNLYFGDIKRFVDSFEKYFSGVLNDNSGKHEHIMQNGCSLQFSQANEYRKSHLYITINPKDQNGNQTVSFDMADSTSLYKTSEITITLRDFVNIFELCKQLVSDYVSLSTQMLNICNQERYMEKISFIENSYEKMIKTMSQEMHDLKEFVIQNNQTLQAQQPNVVQQLPSTKKDLIFISEYNDSTSSQVLPSDLKIHNNIEENSQKSNTIVSSSPLNLDAAHKQVAPIETFRNDEDEQIDIDDDEFGEPIFYEKSIDGIYDEYKNESSEKITNIEEDKHLENIQNQSSENSDDESNHIFFNRPIIDMFMNRNYKNLENWATSIYCLDKSSSESSMNVITNLMHMCSISSHVIDKIEEMNPDLMEYQHILILCIKDGVKNFIDVGKFGKLPILKLNLTKSTELERFIIDVATIISIHHISMKKYFDLFKKDNVPAYNNIRTTHFVFKTICNSLLHSYYSLLTTKKEKEKFIESIQENFITCSGESGILPQLKEIYEANGPNNGQFIISHLTNECEKLIQLLLTGLENITPIESIDNFYKEVTDFKITKPDIEIKTSNDIKKILYKKFDQMLENVQDDKMILFLKLIEKVLPSESIEKLKSECDGKYSELVKYLKNNELPIEVHRIKQAIDTSKSLNIKEVRKQILNLEKTASDVITKHMSIKDENNSIEKDGYEDDKYKQLENEINDDEVLNNLFGGREPV